MIDPLKVWSAENRTRLLLLAFAMTAVIAAVDWVHPTFISLGFLYIGPVMLAGGYGNRPAIVAMAVVCAALQEAFGDLPEHESYVRFLLTVIGFGATGLFVSETVRNRRLVSKYVDDLEEQIRLRRDAEEQLRALVENSPAAIVTIDAGGRILLSNEAARELFLGGEGSLEGHGIGQFMPALLTAVETRPSRAFRTSLQGKATRANGDVFLADAWFSTYSTSTGARLAAIIVDISDDFRAREDSSLDHLLRHTRIVMSAIAHEIRNISGAVLIAHRNLSRVPTLAGNEDFAALGTLIGSLERLAGDQLRPLAVSEPGTVDLAALLDELRVVTQAMLDEDGIASKWPSSTDLPMVEADRYGLMQVFLNLIRNSARALQGSCDGLLEITVSSEGPRVAVRFADNGPGVQNPDELFRPFVRRDGQGGLGLFVSRAIARSFGGDLVHEPGQGRTCFVVSVRTVPTLGEVGYA